MLRLTSVPIIPTMVDAVALAATVSSSEEFFLSKTMTTWVLRRAGGKAGRHARRAF
jgi:hypothetical protein